MYMAVVGSVKMMREVSISNLITFTILSCLSLSLAVTHNNNLTCSCCSSQMWSYLHVDGMKLKLTYQRMDGTSQSNLQLIRGLENDLAWARDDVAWLQEDVDDIKAEKEA